MHTCIFSGSTHSSKLIAACNGVRPLLSTTYIQLLICIIDTSSSAYIQVSSIHNDFTYYISMMISEIIISKHVDSDKNSEGDGR